MDNGEKDSVITIDKIDNINDVLRYYHQIISATSNEVIIDLSDTDFIRSSFVCILGLAKVTQESRGKKVQIIEPRNQRVKKVLVGIGFLKEGKHSQGMIVYRNIKLNEEEGKKVVFDKVVMIVNGKKSKVGQPYVEKASVEGVIIKTDRAKKIIVYKQRPKKGYRKKQGHRQGFTRVMISKIRTSAQKKAEAATEAE